MSQIYADQFCDWLEEAGYTHCFFVSGGNIMHLLNSARKRFTCIPVVHEVAAGIAAEYFNETSSEKRAFAMVTAGPGITNIVTAIAGAWLESRELLVVAGQVKSSDLASPEIRQRGIQEVGGVAILSSITKSAVQLKKPLPKSKILELCQESRQGKAGPVFMEICLDVQGSPGDDKLSDSKPVQPESKKGPTVAQIAELNLAISFSARPIILLGGGVPRNSMAQLLPHLQTISIPVMTTWNGLDRIDASHPLYWGRPNTWGQRSSNVLLQQTDLVIAIGTRLGLQQTGFNWKGFAPLAKVIQVDIDEAELSKGHPHVDLPICADSTAVLNAITSDSASIERWREWKAFGEKVLTLLPHNEPINSHSPEFLSPYDFVESLSKILRKDDVLIPCSSGGAFTTVMQTFRQQVGQKVVTNKGLASMGYGLSGAIGAAYANPGKRTILIEGDGGFSQNIQEIGTVAVGNLPIKIFIFDDGGYASIRMTQANYFNGEYVGCDRATGLGLPNWLPLFTSYGVRAHTLDARNPLSSEVLAMLADDKPAAFIVPIDPKQTYFPKIASRVMENGMMESNPLHLMSPELPQKMASQVLKYLQA
jgi:acetolactate synthase-1/2/3 large subunit